MPRSGTSGRGKATVTLSQIAELSGFQPSAVSNWRKRFEDFPRPVEAAPGGRDLFALSEVEAWLEMHDRFDPDRKNEKLLFEAADVVRGQAGSAEVVEILATAIALTHAVELAGISKHKSPIAANLIQQVERRNAEFKDVFRPLEVIEPAKAAKVIALVEGLAFEERVGMFDWVLQRRTRFVETRTSEQLLYLLSMLSEGASSVFDPAAGEGGLLMAVAEATSERLSLYGQEINDVAWRLARQRFLLHATHPELRLGDSLRDDAFPDLRVDAVVCDPPYGMTNPLTAAALSDPRWSFGLVNAKSADYLWLQHVIHHLAEDGRGYVLLPAASLTRRGSDTELRQELLRRGAVEAIVSLAAGTAQHTAIPLALWVVQRPATTTEPQPVLLIDGASGGTPGARLTLDEGVSTRIAYTIGQWRYAGEVYEDEPGFASAIPVLELLGGDSNLIPARWSYYEASIDPRRRHEELSTAIARLTDAHRAVLSAPAKIDVAGRSEPSTWVSIRDLAASDIAEVIRGVRVRPEDRLASGIRALRTRDIRDEILGEDPSYIDPERLKQRPVLTAPGDIVVSPASGQLRAVVDERGGHALTFPLQGLRLRSDWLDPHVAAAFLESPRNRRFVTGTTYGYARIDVRDLELPALPLEEAVRLREALDQLAETERGAHELAASAREIRQKMLDFPAHTDGDAARYSSPERKSKARRESRRAS